PLEMRMQTSDMAPAEAGTLEAILCKVAVRESEDGRPRQVKVELSSEADMFFHYSHVVDEKGFNFMRDEQKLMVDFTSYANVLAQSLNNAIKVCGDGHGRPTARARALHARVVKGMRARCLLLACVWRGVA
ncbi:hypothetical protein EON67_08025, partial [archaeon]